MPARPVPEEGHGALEQGQGGLRLRLARLAGGLSQEQLAATATVSRQAVAGIEAGRFDPSLRVALALARALGRSVEELFGPPAASAAVPATLLGRLDGLDGLGRLGGRVELAQVGATRVAVALRGDQAMGAGFLPAAGRIADDGTPEGAGAGGSWPGVLVEITRGDLGGVLVVAGCDPALALLAGPLSALTPPVRLAWLSCNSTQALELAGAGLVHAAGVHLAEGSPGVDRLAGRGLRERGAEVIGFGAWQEGLALRPEMASRGKGPVGLAGAAERGLRLVNREEGSEARQLVDAELSREGLDPARVPGYDSQLTAHLLVASAVASGLGEMGITMEPAARAYGLAFEPLAAETFQLVVVRTTLHTPETQALLRVLSAPSLRGELAGLAGYDPSSCGEAICSL